MRRFLAFGIVLCAAACANTSENRAQSSAEGVTDDGNTITLTNGIVTVTIDAHTGATDYAFAGATPIHAAHAAVDLGNGPIPTTSYPTHRVASSSGGSTVVESTALGKPTIQQIFTLEPGKPYLTLETQVVSIDGSALASNHISPIVSSNVAVPGADPRLLDVPFDNDDWVRYDARSLGDAGVSGTGYEVSTVYESQSGHGLVVGSVTHDFWKTGIAYTGASGGVSSFEVYGGAATPDLPEDGKGPTYGKDGTHDVAKHGAMTGTTLVSPRLFIGYFDDWRDGMEEFGRANARVAPPRTWTGGVPFGWNSWAAFKFTLTADALIATSDYIKNTLGDAFSNGQPVYVNIDAGLKTDAAPIIQHVHANGQKAGTYAAPFTYFYSGDATAALAKPVGTSGYTYNDVVLHDDAGNPIPRHGSGYALDVTHPAVRAAMAANIQNDVAKGFDWLKLDFMTDGALEGKHYDPTVKTGIQAYNQALGYLTSLIPDNVFVSLSIAPIFPTQYAHSRRISCDVVGQLNDLMAPAYPHFGSTEYLLNSVTFGWWLNGTAIPFNDPDVMALYKFGPGGAVVKPEWAQARVTASAIAGTVFLDSTDYTTPASAAQATPLLTNPGINAIARNGGTFRPLNGAVGYVTPTPANDGSEASDVFIRVDADATYLAVFNYDAANTTSKTIPLDKAYAVSDVWNASSLPPANGTLTISLAAGQARMLKLTAK